MFFCGKCLGLLQDKDVFLTCSGTCNKNFHFDCVEVSTDVHRYLKSVSGLTWKCNDCVRKCFCLDSDGLNIFLEKKFSDMVDGLKSVFGDLKTDLLKSAELQLQSINSDSKSFPSFSEIIKNKTKPAVIIEPKVPRQDAVQTKTDVTSSINPVDVDIKIAKVKNVRNGGILVGCSSNEENTRFKKYAEEKLADNYVIREVKGILPKVKIVGISQKYNNEELSDLVEHVIKMNSSIFNLNSICKVLKFFPTKKNNNIFQAVLQVDRDSYDRLMSAGNLFVGYDFCSVFDALDVYRCFHCNEFGHTHRVCKNKLCCPRCGQEHELKNCTVMNLKCPNCVKLSTKDNVDRELAHAVWDTRCPVYMTALEKLKSDILSA